MVKRKPATKQPKLRRANGQFARGRTGNANGRPPLFRGELAEHVAGSISKAKLARQLIRLAYQGDPRALDRVVQMLESHQSATNASPTDYSLLNNEELKVLHGLYTKARGEQSRNLLGDVRALLQSLEPAMSEVVPVDDAPVDDPAVEVETSRPIEQPSAPPAAEALPPAAPSKVESLTSGLFRRDGWLKDDNANSVWDDELPN